MTRPVLACLLLMLPGVLPAFSMSRAPVTPDPSHIKSEYAGLWPHLNLEEARRLHGRPQVLFVDGRSLGDWEAGRIPGALSLPTGEFDKRYPVLRAKLRKAEVAVIYCHGENCAQADYLAQLLAEKGHRNMAVFTGGFPAWRKAKLPVHQAKKAKP